MFRFIFGGASIAVLLTTTGCTMCCHPYDYCGPVYSTPDGSGCNSCGSCNGGFCSHARAGSILDGSQEASVESSGTPTPVPQPTRAKRQVSKQSQETPNSSARSSTRYYKTNPQGQREYRQQREYGEQLVSYNGYNPADVRPQARNQTRTQQGAQYGLTQEQMQAQRQARAAQAQRQARIQAQMQAQWQGRPQAPMVARTQPPTQVRAPKRVYMGEVAGSEQIVSTSDRVVTQTGQTRSVPPTTATASMPSASPSAGPALAANDSALEMSETSSSSQQLPASGWTARRSTTEVLR